MAQLGTSAARSRSPSRRDDGGDAWRRPAHCSRPCPCPCRSSPWIAHPDQSAKSARPARRARRLPAPYTCASENLRSRRSCPSAAPTWLPPTRRPDGPPAPSRWPARSLCLQLAPCGALSSAREDPAQPDRPAAIALEEHHQSILHSHLDLLLPTPICAGRADGHGFHQVLPEDERLAIERHMRELDRLDEDLKVI